MAEKKKCTALARLTPNTVSVVMDGKEVRVPLNKDENAILNMIMASQGRSLIQRAMKKWEDDEQTPTPKELRDIAGAMRDIAGFSAEVYASTPAVEPPSEKLVDKPDGALDFSKMSKPIEVKADETPQVVSGQPIPGVPKTNPGST